MDEDRLEPKLERTADILRASNPRPPAGFVASLERRLLPTEPDARSPRRRARLAAAGAVAAMAASVLGLSLAGVGPLSLGGGDGTSAESRCRFVPQTTRERVPVVVTDRQGRAHIVERERRVTRSVRRCP